MLSTPAPFPHVGSFALFIDPTRHVTRQRAELVRVMRRDDRAGTVAVSFPLRTGACGFQIVAESDLIDATPLDAAERREHADLERHLHGRTRLTPKLKIDLARSEALRKRAIYSVILESELAITRAREAGEVRRGRGSIGRPLPREAA